MTALARDDEFVWLPGAVAADLANYITYLERRTRPPMNLTDRRVVCHLKPELLAFLSTCASFPTVARTPEIVRRCDEMSASDAGPILGVTGRRVRQLLGEGRLEGRLTPAGWLITRRSVEACKNERTAT